MKNYHETIIDLIGYILGNGHDYLAKIDSGNAYDKILRNYHQFNLNGDKVYRNIPLMQIHYRFTKEAWQNRENIKELYFEHLVPLKIIKEDLRNLIGNDISVDDINAIINKTEIVVLTKKQATLLDEKFKSDIPKDGMDRLQVMDYQIEPHTEKNSIFNLNSSNS
jgi:hypothetical protein